MARLSFLKLILLGLLLCLYPALCSGISADDKSAIMENKKSIVLFKLISKVDGKVNEVLEGPWEIGLGSLDKGTQITLFDNSYPESLSKDKGWFYIVLAPGSYYLAIAPPIGANHNPFHSHYEYKPFPCFQFIVESGKPVQYIGSVQVECASVALLVGRTLESCALQGTISDDTDEAKKVAINDYRDFGVMTTVLMKHYAEAIDLKKATTFPLATSVSCVKSLQPVPWMDRSLEHNMGWGPKKPSETIDSSGFMNIFTWLYTPVGATVGYFGGEADRGKWEPCLQDMNKDFAATDYTSKLYDVLSAAFSANGAVLEPITSTANAMVEAATRGSKGLLEVTVQQVRLRECEDLGNFSVEVAVRAKLSDVATQGILSDTVYLYTNPSGRPDPLKYEQQFKNIALPFYPAYDVMVKEPSPNNKLESFCGETGKKILNDAMDSAMKSVAQKMVIDMELNQK